MSIDLSNSETLIIIPARLAATRLPNKPLAEICGLTMIERVINQALLADIAPVYVATPDPEIFNLVQKTLAIPIITDIKHESGTDRIFEALCKIDPIKKIKHVVNLQGDLPTIKPSSIVKLVDLLRKSNVDITTLATIINDSKQIHNPNCVKIAYCSNTKNALYFSRSEIPYNAEKYFHHIGIYGYSRSALEKFVNLPVSNLEKVEKLEQLRALENDMKISVEIIDETPLAVDTFEDLQKIINYINNDIDKTK